jgi:hypothetical protein
MQINHALQILVISVCHFHLVEPCGERLRHLAHAYGLMKYFILRVSKRLDNDFHVVNI